MIDLNEAEKLLLDEQKARLQALTSSSQDPLLKEANTQPEETGGLHNKMSILLKGYDDSGDDDNDSMKSSDSFTKDYLIP